MVVSTAASFSNPLEAEPTDDWTVEQVLQWFHQKSQLTISQKTNDLVDALEEQYINAEREIWELHRLAQEQDGESDEVAAGGNEHGDTCRSSEHQSPMMDEENVSPKNHMEDNYHVEPIKVSSEETSDTNQAMPEQTEQTLSKGKSNATASVSCRGVHIDILTGPHEGATYFLKPRKNRPCEIGRSKGKKFRERGISLHKDSEVSTSHGKFELRGGGVTSGGKMCYTDTGSTNGTSHLGVALEDHVPLELESGMVLVFGESELKITLMG